MSRAPVPTVPCRSRAFIAVTMVSQFVSMKIRDALSERARQFARLHVLGLPRPACVAIAILRLRAYEGKAAGITWRLTRDRRYETGGSIYKRDYICTGDSRDRRTNREDTKRPRARSARQ